MVAQPLTGIAALDVTTEPLGATRFDRGHRTILHRSKLLCCLIRRTVAREDLREFYLSPCRIRDLRMHRCLPACLMGAREQVCGRAAARQVLLREMEVALRGRDVPMSEQYWMVCTSVPASS